MLADEKSQIEASFFKESFYENEEKMLKDQIVVIQGQAGVDNFTNNFVIKAKQILTLDEAVGLYCNKICFATTSSDPIGFSQQLNKMLQDHGRGKARIYIHHDHNGIITNLKLGEGFKIRPSYKLIKEAQKSTSIYKVYLK